MFISGLKSIFEMQTFLIIKLRVMKTFVLNKELRKLVALAVLSCIWIIQLSAQETVNYKVLLDDPDETHPLSISLNPWYVDAWMDVNVNMGYGLEARYRFMDKLNFTGRWDHGGYLNSSSTTNANGKTNVFNYFEGGAGYILLSGDKYKPVQVRLGESGNYVYSINAKGTKRNEMLGRFGLYYCRTPYERGFNDYDLNMVGYYAGISWVNYANIILKAEGWKTSRMQKYLDFYFDIMHAPVINLTNANSVKKNFGWRMGYAFYWSVARTITFNSRTEFGSRPGVSPSKMAIYMNFGMTVNLL